MTQGDTSLPSWERGLKYRVGCKQTFRIASLPSWERGLKLYYIPVNGADLDGSLPSWERGLKSIC